MIPVFSLSSTAFILKLQPNVAEATHCDATPTVTPPPSDLRSGLWIGGPNFHTHCHPSTSQHTWSTSQITAFSSTKASHHHAVIVQSPFRKEDSLLANCGFIRREHSICLCELYLWNIITSVASLISRCSSVCFYVGMCTNVKKIKHHKKRKPRHHRIPM